MKTRPANFNQANKIVEEEGSSSSSDSETSPSISQSSNSIKKTGKSQSVNPLSAGLSKTSPSVSVSDKDVQSKAKKSTEVSPNRVVEEQPSHAEIS